MSAPPMSGGAPIHNKTQLIEYFEGGSKPKNEWRIGTEHEKFVFRLNDLRPVPYEGHKGLGHLLTLLVEFGWEPISENGNVIALSHGGCSITLEPGGQLELSGAPLPSIHQTCREVGLHLQQMKEVCKKLGLGMVGLGFQPKWARDDTPWMPKGRTAIMRNYMPKKGHLGLDMMARTCTVQVNLDYGSEADMVKKLRVSLALQPIAVSLFSDSPFSEGKPNGFLSYRSHIWTDTDHDRCGMLPFAFESGMGFERYVDYLLDVPMYFVYRNGKYIDVAGQSFRDFMAGRLPGLPGEVATMGDFVEHVGTVFPEVRLKRFLEMRGADGGPWDRLCALPALWVGLLYDDTALNDAYTLVQNWTVDEMAELRRHVPRSALKTHFRGRLVRDWALDVISISRRGLSRRAARDSAGGDETGFLNILQTIADSGITPAEEKLALYHKKWHESVDPIFTDYAY